MPFVKNDPRINRKGRPTMEERMTGLTNAELKQRELIMLLRKFRPHVATAVSRAAAILTNEEAQHHNQLKAATVILDAYRKLVIDLYDGEDPEQEGEEVQQQNAAVFSLKVIDGDEDK